LDLGTVDEGNVDLFEVIVQHVMNDRRGINARPRERSEEQYCGPLRAYGLDLVEGTNV
jgi:hypothetical protein